jgi:hypothetical protein
MIGIGAVIAVAFAMALFAPPAKAINDPPNGGVQTVTGDWTVTDARTYANTRIYIESGSLTIQAGGSLSMTTVSIIFNSSTDYGYKLDLQAGGVLTSATNSLVTANYTNIHYGLFIGGFASLNNSFLQCGDLTVLTCGTLNMRTDNMFVESGKITVQTGGVMNLATSVNMRFNDTVDYGSSLNVQTGGAFMCEATSLITSNNTLIRYGMNVGGFASINSTFLQCGDLTVQTGGTLNMRTDNMFVESGKITVQTGGVMNLAASVKIFFNNTVDYGSSLNVQTGGAFMCEATSLITSNNTLIHFGIYIGGFASINSTNIQAGDLAVQNGGYMNTRSVVVWLESSNLSVQTGGILNIVTTRLVFNNTVDYGFWLDVQPGAMMTSDTTSLITSNNTFIHFGFTVGGRASLNNTNIMCGDLFVRADGFMYMRADTVWMENGNLTVQTGGSLTLITVKWMFNNTVDYGFMLTVKSGGTLLTDTTCAINSNRTFIRYNINIAGYASMNSTTLQSGEFNVISGAYLYMRSDVVYVEYGNLTIQAGAIMNLSATRLLFNSSVEYGYTLMVQTGGALMTEAASIIMSNNTYIHYNLNIMGYASLNSTTLQAGNLPVMTGSSIYMLGSTVWMEYGNLTVQAGGYMNLTNTKWFFNNTWRGMYSFNVDSGGVLISDGGTLITTNNTQFYNKFIIRGSAWVNNTRIAYTWGDNASWVGGVQIYSDNVTITNSTICLGMTGGISVFGCSPTIYRNTINGSGQAGNSSIYCFGIYMYNSNANISGNQVFDNTVRIASSFNPTTTITLSPLPTSGQHWFNDTMMMYTGTGNGGYFGNWARTQTGVLYQRTACYGTGVYIDSCPNATLYNNSIRMNGYVAYSGVATIERVYEGYGAGCSTVLLYQGFGEHWCTYTNITYYYVNTLYGVGVYVKDSIINMVMNTVDENGFETSQTQLTNEPTYGFYYGGTAVSMSNSHGLIMSNNIKNSPILVNLVRSDPIIIGNILVSDFITGGTYTSQVIPWRIAYGIKCDPNSLPTITNNTISFIYKDANNNIVFTGGTGVVNMDAVIAIELPLSVKNYILSGNSISFTASGNGFTAAFGLNLTYKCSGVQLRDNSFSYAFTGTKTGNAPQFLVQVTLLSDNIVINNCIFKGPGVGTMPTTYGVNCNYGSVISVTCSTFNGCHFGVTTTDFSTLDMNLCNMYNIITSGIWLEQSSKGTVTATTISGIGRSLTVIRSAMTISGSTLSCIPEFYVDKGGTIEVQNTAHNRGAVIIVDMASYVNVTWPIKIMVQWGGGDTPVPIEGANVLLKTLMGATISEGMTDSSGRPFTMIWITDYQAHNQVVTMFNPHRLTVTKGRASSMDLYMLSQPLDIVFNLLDNVPPELVITSPAENQQLNYSLVTITGRASDMEAGLVDGRISVNVDNTGWIPLTVLDGQWSLELRLANGLHIIRILAEDLVGNTIRTSLSLTIDTEPPNLRVFTPVDDSSTSQRTVVVSGLSDDDAFVTVNGIVVVVRNRFYSTQVSLEDGLNSIVVAASDPSGNTRTVTVDVSVDALQPILEITSPKTESYINQDPITLTGTTELNAIVKVNGELAQMNGTNFETLVAISEGANSITVVATDLAGNFATRTITVYRDTTAPDLSVFTPREEMWTNQSRMLINGITEQGATVTINGQNVQVQTTIFSFYMNLLEGANRIVISARDSGGNSQTLTRTVYLDTRPPELLLASPLDKVHLATPVVVVTGSTDWGSEVYLNGELMPVTDFVFSTSLRFDSDGTKTIEIFTRDLAGNTATSTRTVYIDTSKPFISISYPLDNTKVDHRMITISGQTESGATIVVNTETIVKIGDDGLFTVPVVLEDGVNRVTVKALDASGNNETASVTVTKTVVAVETAADISWTLNLTGMLIGIGIALPIATYLITDSRRRGRAKVLAEIDAAEQERKEKEAMLARKAALPTVERIGKRRVKEPAPKPEEPPQEPPKMSTPPAAEAPAAPEVAKAGLKDKSGTEEVSPDDTEQASKMDGPKAPSAVEGAEAPKAQADTTLKDKGTEAEGAAEETELVEGVKKKPRQ